MKTLKIITIIVLLASCSTDDAPVDQEALLPPITSTGENTFGCLVDGKYFRPRDGRITINSDNKGLRIVQSETDNWELHVYDRKSAKTISLFIHLEDLFILGEGLYELNEATGLRGIDGPNHNYIYGRFWKNSEVGYQKYISYSGSGYVEITKRDFIDGTLNIYSGTFDTRLINIENVSDTIHLALGRFDLEAYSHQNHDWD